MVTGKQIVRRLAAIMSIDVVGYARLMSADESGTHFRLKTHRTERIEPAVRRHGGRLIKLTGDGAMIEFGSAVEALSAAIEIQQAMADANRDQPPDTAVVFRIGLDLGDLMVDDNELYGDGVNIAVRLEGAAPAGGILISGNMHDAVAGRLEAGFEDPGSLELKNIAKAVRAWRVTLSSEDWSGKIDPVPAPSIAPARLAVPPPPPANPSFPLLPFTNMSGDPERSISLTHHRGHITELSSSTSCSSCPQQHLHYKGRAVTCGRGGELGVRYVLKAASARRSIESGHRPADRRAERQPYLGGAIRPVLEDIFAVRRS